MDRQTDQDGSDFEDRTVGIDIQFTATTAGAVGTVTRSKGVKTIALSGTEYTVTLQDVYFAFLNLKATAKQATFAAAGAQLGVPTTINVGAASTSPNTVGITFTKGSDGTAVALATGDVAYIHLRLKR